MNKRKLASGIFTPVLLTGLAACLICDTAISGRLTWSPIPGASIVFAWLVFFPCLRWGKTGVTAGLVLLSVLLVPYLLALSRLTGVGEVFSVGAPTAALSLVFVWACAAILRRGGRAGRLPALGAVFALAAPFVFAVNLLLSRLIGEPVVDIWDILTEALLLILACLCFVLGRAGKGKQKG